MITENRFQAVQEILDLSKRENFEDTHDDNLLLILREFSTQNISLNDAESIENVLKEMGLRLQFQESISMILHSMKDSQLRMLQTQQLESNDEREDKNVVPIEKMDNGPFIVKEDNTRQLITELHLSMNMARKLLDHQFLSRQKLIQSQMEKAIYDIPMKRPPQYKVDSTFIPAMSNDFLPLTGLSEIVDLLKNDSYFNSDNKSPEVSRRELNKCAQCGSSVSPSWKKRRLDVVREETVCPSCHDSVYQTHMRQEYEDEILRIKCQFEEQEKNLVRDYNDMLVSPHKLELFRQEQEKKQRLAANKGRPVIHLSTAAVRAPQIQKTQAERRTVIEDGASPRTMSAVPTHKDGPSVQEHTTDGAQNISPYLQMIQALAFQSANPQVSMDSDQSRKIQQLLALLQGNPSLANNNIALVQLLSTVCTNNAGTSNIQAQQQNNK